MLPCRIQTMLFTVIAQLSWLRFESLLYFKFSQKIKSLKAWELRCSKQYTYSTHLPSALSNASRSENNTWKTLILSQFLSLFPPGLQWVSVSVWLYVSVNEYVCLSLSGGELQEPDGLLNFYLIKKTSKIEMHSHWICPGMQNEWFHHRLKQFQTFHSSRKKWTFAS